jgi:hypothetical protein
VKVDKSEITNPWLLSYLKAKGIKDGDEMEQYEYMFWIQQKHKQFRGLKRITGYRGYTEKEREEFDRFLKEGAKVKGKDEI